MAVQISNLDNSSGDKTENKWYCSLFVKCIYLRYPIQLHWIPWYWAGGCI